MPFDPNKPFEIEGAPAATEASPSGAKFDPTQPFEVEATEAPLPVPPIPPKAPEVKFPHDDPGYKYGDIWPVRYKLDDAGNPISGSEELAFPEAIRSPARGVLDINKRLQGPLTPEKIEGLNPDELAAVTAFVGGGAKPFAGKVAIDTIKPMALEARRAGYVLPPLSIDKEPGIVAKVLSGWSGKIKTAQQASAINQEVTNKLASQALGVPEGAPLTEQIFNQVRENAGKAYQTVAAAVPEITADEGYLSAVAALGGKNSQAAKLFPKIVDNPGIKQLVEELTAVPNMPTDVGVELVRELRFNATHNLKSRDDPSKVALGMAQRDAANAVDDLIQRNIEAVGKDPSIVDAYKAARTLIAKTYDVEAATNPATGDVSARVLARLDDQGRPLTEQLKTIANVAHAFPRATQNPATFGDVEPWSILDAAAASAAALHGNPVIAAPFALRPVGRAVALSPSFQNAMAGLPTFGKGPVAGPPPMPIPRTAGPAIIGVLGGAEERSEPR